MTELTPGLAGEAAEIVSAENTAARWGSGMVAGFATPAMVALLENAAFHATAALLPPGQTTVGVEIHVEHLAATPAGMSVRARAELVQVEGRRLLFRVEVWDEVEQIGRGTHVRYIVDLDRFEKRLADKRARTNSL